MDGVVYPGEVTSTVVLEPVNSLLVSDVACSGVTTSCSAHVTSEGIYKVSLTLTNAVGPSRVLDTFDCEWTMCMITHCSSLHHYSMQ